MKDIKGYEGLYGITSCGKVWSYRGKKFLFPYSNSKGYLRVTLCKDGKREQFSVHRLVAEAYIPNPDNLPQINHKDENKTNNCVNNLEWCDNKYNSNYGTAQKRRAKKISKKVYCKELNRIFNSQIEAARELNLSQGNISRVCRGISQTTGGYHFEYIEEEE